MSVCSRIFLVLHTDRIHGFEREVGWATRRLYGRLSLQFLLLLVCQREVCACFGSRHVPKGWMFQREVYRRGHSLSTNQLIWSAEGTNGFFIRGCPALVQSWAPCGSLVTTHRRQRGQAESPHRKLSHQSTNNNTFYHDIDMRMLMTLIFGAAV